MPSYVIEMYKIIDLYRVKEVVLILYVFVFKFLVITLRLGSALGSEAQHVFSAGHGFHSASSHIRR